jgi:hypothetical protein
VDLKDETLEPTIGDELGRASGLTRTAIGTIVRRAREPTPTARAQAAAGTVTQQGLLQIITVSHRRPAQLGGGSRCGLSWNRRAINFRKFAPT